MKSVDDIIDLWPSMADLGRDLGLAYSTVAAWKQRGSIPVQYWLGIIRAARKRGNVGVTSDLLTAAHGQSTLGSQTEGLAHDGSAFDATPTKTKTAESPGQFSRWRALRRSHFASMDEVVDHVHALRDEWDRR